MYRTKGLSQHHKWLLLDDLRAQQLDVWRTIILRLEARPGWFELTPKAQAELRRASGLNDLDASLRRLQGRRRRLLQKLDTSQQADVQGVLANLQVAERLVQPEENVVVAGLISQAVRDLKAIRGTIGSGKHQAARPTARLVEPRRAECLK